MEFSAEMIASVLDGDIVGDPKVTVSGLAKIEEGRPGTLSFLANPKYEHYIYGTRSSIVIVNRSFTPKEAVGATMIRVDDAYGCFAKLLAMYEQSRPKPSGISSQAVIDPQAVVSDDAYVGALTVIESGARIGSGCRIYPQAYIGFGVRIGDNVTIYPGVRIYEGCVIGNGVTIHAGAVIGADGFGFAPNAEGSYDKIPQIGNVVIEDDVEIGANTCVDRATMGSTVIGRGTKLDNLIQVAHNVTVGQSTVMAAQSGIAGSAHVGSRCMLGGQSGVVGHITVGDGVQIGSKSGVTNNVPDGQTVMGYPHMQVGRFRRANAVTRNLPELQQRVAALERRLDTLSSGTDD